MPVRQNAPVTIERLRECFHYDMETGQLLHRERAAYQFQDRLNLTAEQQATLWNAQYANKVAGWIGNHNYRAVVVNYKTLLAHRVIWAIVTGAWPQKVDHQNGDRSDNRWMNLREVTPSENNKNAKRRADNKSGVCGVSWDKRTKKWTSRIRHDGKYHYLGQYINKPDAVAVRKSAEREFGFHENHGRSK